MGWPTSPNQALSNMYSPDDPDKIPALKAPVTTSGIPGDLNQPDPDIPDLDHRNPDHATSPSADEIGLASGGSIGSEQPDAPDWKNVTMPGVAKMGGYSQGGPPAWQGDMPDVNKFDIGKQAAGELEAQGKGDHPTGWGRVGRFALGLATHGLADGVNQARFGAHQEYQGRLGERTGQLKTAYDLRSREIDDREKNARAYKDYAQGEAALRPKPGPAERPAFDLSSLKPEDRLHVLQFASEHNISSDEALKHMYGGEMSDQPIPAITKPEKPAYTPQERFNAQTAHGLKLTNDSAEFAGDPALAGTVIKDPVKAAPAEKIMQHEADDRAANKLKTLISPKLLQEGASNAEWIALGQHLGFSPTDPTMGVLLQKIGAQVAEHIPLERMGEFQQLKALLSERIMHGEDPSPDQIQIPTGLGGPPDPAARENAMRANNEAPGSSAAQPTISKEATGSISPPAAKPPAKQLVPATAPKATAAASSVRAKDHTNPRAEKIAKLEGLLKAGIHPKRAGTADEQLTDDETKAIKELIEKAKNAPR